MKAKTKEERDLDSFAYTIVIHALKFGVPEAPKIWKHTKFKSYFDIKAKTKILEFRMQFLGNRNPKADPIFFDVPATPFDFFLQVYAPEWLLKLRPVRVLPHAVVPPVQVNICPHHDLDWKRSRAIHQRFIVGDQK